MAVQHFARSTSTGSLTPLDTALRTPVDGSWRLTFSPSETDIYVVFRNSATVTQPDGVAHIPVTSDGRLGNPTLYIHDGSSIDMVWPRDVLVSHDGRNVYTCSAVSNRITSFDRTFTGTLTNPFNMPQDLPSCNGLALHSSDRHIYAIADDVVVHYSRNPLSGLLTRLVTLTASSNPRGIVLRESDIYVTSWGTSLLNHFTIAFDGSLTMQQSYGNNSFHFRPIGVDVSPDGRLVIVGSDNNGNLAMYERSTTLGTLTPSQNVATCSALEEVKFSPDGETIYMACHFSGTLVKWNLRSAYFGQPEEPFTFELIWAAYALAGLVVLYAAYWLCCANVKDKNMARRRKGSDTSSLSSFSSGSSFTTDDDSSSVSSGYSDSSASSYSSSGYSSSSGSSSGYSSNSGSSGYSSSIDSSGYIGGSSSGYTGSY